MIPASARIVEYSAFGGCISVEADIHIIVSRLYHSYIYFAVNGQYTVEEEGLIFVEFVDYKRHNGIAAVNGIAGFIVIVVPDGKFDVFQVAVVKG